MTPRCTHWDALGLSGPTLPACPWCEIERLRAALNWAVDNHLARYDGKLMQHGCAMRVGYGGWYEPQIPLQFADLFISIDEPSQLSNLIMSTFVVELGNIIFSVVGNELSIETDQYGDSSSGCLTKDQARQLVAHLQQWLDEPSSGPAA